MTIAQQKPAVRCLYRNAPEHDCGARACPLHGTPSASPYGKRQGAWRPVYVPFDKQGDVDPFNVQADWEERA